MCACLCTSVMSHSHQDCRWLSPGLSSRIFQARILGGFCIFLWVSLHLVSICLQRGRPGVQTLSIFPEKEWHPLSTFQKIPWSQYLCKHVHGRKEFVLRIEWLTFALFSKGSLHSMTWNWELLSLLLYKQHPLYEGCSSVGPIAWQLPGNPFSKLLTALTICSLQDSRAHVLNLSSRQHTEQRCQKAVLLGRTLFFIEENSEISSRYLCKVVLVPDEIPHRVGPNQFGQVAKRTAMTTELCVSMPKD